MSSQPAPNQPRPIRVQASGGEPVRVGAEVVESIRESWIVEDRWWTGRPIHRHYWEVVTAGGCNVVVFRDLVRDRWFTQRA
ncbi:MAG: hypothetical protein ACRDK7_04350 [Solirubrobacteraceae bacterium]